MSSKRICFHEIRAAVLGPQGFSEPLAIVFIKIFIILYLGLICKNGCILVIDVFSKLMAMSEYIYSAISNRRICAAYARFGSQSHLDRHEALSCIRLFAPKRVSPAPLRLCGSVLSVKLSDIAKLISK